MAYTLYVAAHLRLCRDLAGLRLRPLVAPLLGSLAAAGGMALVLLIFGTGEIAVPLVVVGGALGIAVYAAILVLTRQVRLEELTALGRRLRRRPARGELRPADLEQHRAEAQQQPQLLAVLARAEEVGGQQPDEHDDHRPRKDRRAGGRRPGSATPAARPAHHNENASIARNRASPTTPSSASTFR